MRASDGVLSVSALNEYVRRTLAADPMLQRIRLRGEISNFKRHTSGHWYFSLKDDDSRISCVMFRQNTLSVKLMPRDGLQVVLVGSVSLFPRDGAYQFYAEGMREDGLGDLYLRFEELKNRLQKEGLFDASRKRPLPLLPEKVGIVTSRTGAVLHDICRVAWRRFPGMPLALFPAAVQGEGAAQEIARGIEVLGHMPGISVIIVGRGGGSMEDLWAFNEEIVARAIASCPVPVVSAVGHETDFTIADFVADMRAPTPSAAAEVTVPQREGLSEALSQWEARLKRGAERTLMEKQERLSLLQNRLQRLHPRVRVQDALHKAEQLRVRLENSMRFGLSDRQKRLESLSAKLSALGPMQVLNRGYAIAMKEGVPVTAAKITAGDKLRVVFSDGQAQALTERVERGDPFESGKKAGNI
jgi:exodeoxyribonuclease VII large subunit